MAALLLAVGALAFLYNLSGLELWGIDESGYIQRARELLAHQRWFAPTYLGETNFDKPPLFYWLIAASGWIFGQSDAGFRALFPLFGFVGAFLTLAIGTRLYDRTTGLVAAILLSTSFLFLSYARKAFPDLPLTCSVAGALWAYLRATAPGAPVGRWCAVAALCMTTGSLIKGLLAYVLPGLVIGLDLLATRRVRVLRPLIAWSGITALAIAVPYYAATGWPFIRLFFFEHHWQRFLAWGSHRPLLYYLEFLPGDFLPWSFLLPAMLVALASRDLRHDLRLPFLWAGSLLVFFTLSSHKWEPYLLPLFPALALLAARLWQRGWEGTLPRAVLRALQGGLLLEALVLVGVALALPALWPRRFSVPLPWSAWKSALLVAGALILAERTLRRRVGQAFIVALGLAAVLTALVTGSLMPALNPMRSARLVAEQVLRTAAVPELGIYGDVNAAMVVYLAPGARVKVLPDGPEVTRYLADGQARAVLLDQRVADTIPPDPAGGHCLLLRAAYVDGRYLLLSNRCGANALSRRSR
ncbi:MAG: glycosyltransferase family 39 protein [Deltaproteobacteria bacterium]|nr:glycosyltransferase family 39 protein [Deltaproteobacteria bacterium]